jgi:hypothetical protein
MEEMIELIIVIIAALGIRALIVRGFKLGERVTKTSEATTEILLLAVPQEAREKYLATKKEQQEQKWRDDAKTRRMFAIIVWIIIGIAIFSYKLNLMMT